MRTPTARTSMGGLAWLVFLAAGVCVAAGAGDRGRGRHIRRITAADLPASPGNSSNSTVEEPLTNQPGQLIVTEVFNKNTTKDLSSHPKQLDGKEKLSETSSKDLDLDDTNTGNKSNSQEITKLSGEAGSGSQNNFTAKGVIGPEEDPIDIGGSEHSSSISVPRELNLTEIVRENATNNTSTEFGINEGKTPQTSPNATVIQSGSDESTKPKEVVEDNPEERTSTQTIPKVLNATEVLQASSSTYRRRRPVATNSTSTASDRSQELVSEAPPKSSKEVNINEVVSNRSSSRRLRKPILLIKKNGVLVANHTLAETEAIASKNCTGEENNCELKSESNGESKVVEELSAVSNSTVASDSSADEVIATNSKENSIETSTKAKPHDSSSIRSKDGAFNNIDFSSTARMVLQEKIHEDILHHLTTVSYAHYETDYVIDDDADSFDAESQTSKNAPTVSFGNYDVGSDSSNTFTVSATTPRVDSFDETFARISEGIQHNLDEIEERSVEFEATSEGNDDHFGSSSDTGSSYAHEGIPKNDSRISLEYTNKVDIIANNSAIGNAKRGDLKVANATHVDFERMFIETKVIPDVSSTVKYLIDDEYSTTRIIPTNEDSEEETNKIKDVRNRDQSLESAEDDAVVVNLDKAEETSTSATSYEKHINLTESPGFNNRTNLKLNTSNSQPPTNFKAQGRGRMFPSERLHTNNSNNVDQALPETESKRLRARTSQGVNSSNDSSRPIEDTVSPRSRSYLLRDASPLYPGTEHSSVPSRRMSTITAPDALEPTSPRYNFISTGRPLSRYPPYRQGVTVNVHNVPATTSPRVNLLRPGRPSIRYTPQANNSHTQEMTVTDQDVPAPTSPRINLLRVGRPSSRYPPQANNSYTQEMTITNLDVHTTTSPRSNLIRVGRPSSRYPPQENNTRRQVSKEVGTRNDEGNDIPPNNTPPTRNRGEARFAGVSTSSLTNEEYPIPPTAAAWSLVTMKEPSARTKLSGAGLKPSTTLQLIDNDDSDSQPSGSYNKLTTIFNILTPTASMDMTEKDVFSSVETTTQKDFITSTESFIHTSNAGVLQYTTEDSNEGATTQIPEFTTINSSEDEENETFSPVDSSSSNSSVIEDDELRFDIGSTVPSALEFAASTTQQSAVKYKYIGDEIVSTTLGPDTTRAPKEDSDKIDDEDVDVLITTTETSGLLGFGFSDTGMSDDGHGEVAGGSQVEGNHDIIADPKEGEEEGGVGQPVHSDEKDSNQQMDDGHLTQGETDYGGPTGPDAGVDADSLAGSSTTPSTSSSLDDASKASVEGVDSVTTPPTETQTSSIINTDSVTSANDDVPEPMTTTDESVTSVYTSNTSTSTGLDTAGKPATDNVTSTTTSTSTTSTTSTTTTTTSTTTTKPTDGVETNDTRPPPDEHIPPTKNVPSFLRVFVEASPRQFCETVGMFKKAVADLLTKGSGRIVSSDQVVLRNFGRDQCTIPDDQDNSTSATGLLLPVELHLVDEAVNFDRQLNEAFTLIWGQEGMDFPLRILKVDVVATQDEFMTSSIDKAGVIAAIAISCIGAVCLLLLAVLLIVMRKRQKKFNYGMRCTPVSLDAYSLDSVSIHDSVRRKAGLRASKRSYGNPAFDDPSAPSHPLNFAGLSAFSTERGAMEDEFARVPHVTPKADELPPGSETKNRYANVLPLPETRVILSSNPQEQLGDYINANYVAGPNNSANFYIACQAPLLCTVTDFWRMIWEQQSKVIMMLTELVENGVEKCADYLPPSEVLDCHRLFGDFQVTLKKREVREKYVISTLQLKNLESNSWREITHLWYVSWPSQGVPEEPNSMIAFLIEARSYMKNRSGPSVVHCSPGTGRTGTVLACDLSIREFEHTRQVDIPRCVARLRRDRAGCVQTRDQYAFIYQVLNLYATKLTGGALDSI